MKISGNMWYSSKSEWAGKILFFLLTIMPLVLGISYALLYSLGVVGILNNGLTLAIWEEMFVDIEIWLAYVYSLYIAVVSISLSLLISLGIVLYFTDRLDNPSISYFFYLPLSIPAIVMAFYMFQMLGGSGFFSRLSFQFGLISDLQQFPGLINDLAGVGIIVAHVMMATPFFTIFFHNIYRGEQIDSMVELASTLGADNRYIVRFVTLPILLKRGFSTIILYFIFVLGSYEIPLLLGREYPQMLSVLIINKLRRFNLADIPEAYGIAVMYTLLVLAIIVFTYRRGRLKYEI